MKQQNTELHQKKKIDRPMRWTLFDRVLPEGNISLSCWMSILINPSELCNRQSIEREK